MHMISPALHRQESATVIGLRRAGIGAYNPTGENGPVGIGQGIGEPQYQPAQTSNPTAPAARRAPGYRAPGRKR